MDENYKKTKPSWSRWIIWGALSVFVVFVVLPNFIRARTTSAMNACINNLRQIDAAKQQWALENNKTNFDTVVTWDDLSPFLGYGARGSFVTVWCPDDKTKQYSNSYTLGDLNTKPKCKIRPDIDRIN